MKCLHSMVLATIFFYLNSKHLEIMTKEKINQHLLSDSLFTLNYQLKTC